MRTPRTTTPGPGAHADRSATPPRGRRAHAGPPADERPERETAAASSPVGQLPERGSLRPRTVRAKIISLLMVPVVSLLALWGFATVTTAQDVARLREVQRLDNTVRGPVTEAVGALQDERTAALRQLAAPGTGRAETLRERAGRTDAALKALSIGGGHTVADAGPLPAGTAARLTTFLDRMQQLRKARTRILNPSRGGAGELGGTDAGTPDKAAARPRDTGRPTDAETLSAYTQYTDTVTAALDVGGSLTGIQDAETGSGTRVLLELATSGEMLAREESLLASAGLTGRLDGEGLREFTGAVAARRAFAGTAGADLPGTGRQAWRELTEHDAYRRLETAEDTVLGAPSGRRAVKAVSATSWERDTAAVRAELRAIGTAAGQGSAGRTDPVARALLSPAAAAVLLGFLAVAASLVISVRIGRGLVVELVGLRDGALDIARRKLPHAMSRLRTGEEIDVRVEAPSRRTSHDEIGQVAEALDTVHRAALDAAVERAELAGGISGVFVNLARRSQTLVHRQLVLLDAMERRADDPEELGDLFRLDHLTTRMRRHAESLIILSGAAPGRAWRMPVPLTDVVRAAVSEIEDYARVEVRTLPDAAVKGVAVADLTHLLAELVENAAQFSPPHTKVRISGEPVGNGYALEIEDRGLGMSREVLDEANRRIEQSEALDLFDSDRLGLFVVSRLSARHSVKVRLRTSAYGGTTAVVLLPTALLPIGLPAGAEAGTADGAVATAPVGRGHDGPGAGHPRLPSRARIPRLPRPTERPAPVAVPPVGPSANPGTREVEGSGPARVTALHRRPAPTEEDGGLPRRVRQASLVPQLRDRPGPEDSGQYPGRPLPTAERTPEQARDRMTAYRAGWVRGGGAVPGNATAARAVPVSPFRRHTEGDQS
ncbi:nitrate- and nitrite sensing domain-containing protein [Streptomyces sp. NBC_01213]|uniref:sensor histidine kinase n=1 Tax=Streptomyces sp. NBC_01213 TaxID=2903776 RepID=UPI00352D99A9|nr:nitrate- and nitrite sensing domain-containing protein [Streptomyces sp. NBC_01213]